MVAICAACTAAVLGLHQIGCVPFEMAELALRDMVMRFAHRATPDTQLVYLAIDDASINIGANAFSGDLAASPALQKMATGWPWPREVQAMILDRLMQAGARVVAFDVLFPTPRAGDDALKTALDRYRDHVVIGSNFVDAQAAGIAHSLTVPAASLIDDGMADERVGFVNFWPDVTDGIVRLARYRLPASAIFHTPAVKGETVYESLSARVLRKLGRAAQIPDGAKSLRFAPDLDHGGFTPQSVYLLFVSKAWETNFQNGAYFRDKIVVVGPYGNFLKDQLPTPLGLMEGPELHLNALNEALSGHFITEPGSFAITLTILAAGLAALTLSVFVNQPLLRFALLLGTNVLYLAGVIIAYNRGSLLGIVLSPLVVFNGGGIVTLVWQQWVERREGARVRRIFERFVSKNVVREVVDNRESFLHQLGGVRKSVAVLMTDLRGFTTLTEQADSAEIVAQLNEYFSGMVKCVFAADGTLDKFIGDAILAVWGNVHSDGPARDAELAVATALHMQKSLAELNTEWPARGWPVLRMGIGVTFGEVIFGALGSEEKAEPTVIGDPVNLASRLEGLTKEYGVELILSESVATLVRDRFQLQLVDFVRVKGKTQPIQIYTVLGWREQALEVAQAEALQNYENALAKYRAGAFAEAGALFQKCLEHGPNDSLVQMYAARCADLQREPPEEKWDGVFVMKTK